MIEKIEILQHSEDRYLYSHPSEEARRLLDIVMYHHEMVVLLRKESLKSLPEKFVGLGRWYPVLPAQPIRLIMGNVGSLKQVSVGTGIQANLYRLRVNAEDVFASIYLYGFTNIFIEQHSLFAVLVVLPTTDQVGNGARTFIIQSLVEAVLTDNTQCLCRDGKSYHLQIGEGGYNTAARYFPPLVYLIFCFFLQVSRIVPIFATKLCISTIIVLS